jgi:membrane protein DedA with SNARE-associated domain
MTFLERLWAYITLGAMAFVWEEASPLIGGVAAYDEHLAVLPVIFAVTLGTWVVGALLYALGRWQGIGFRKRWPKLRPVVLQAAAIVRRHPWRASLFARFAYGLRLVIPIACGAARVPMWLFLVASAISCFVWSAVFTVIGWKLGETAVQIFGHVKRYMPLIGTVFVALMFVGAWWMRRRHVAEKTKRVLDRKPMLTPPTGIDAIEK